MATRGGLEPGTSCVHDRLEPVPADQAGCLDRPFCGYRSVGYNYCAITFGDGTSQLGCCDTKKHSISILKKYNKYI